MIPQKRLDMRILWLLGLVIHPRSARLRIEEAKEMDNEKINPPPPPPPPRT